MMKVMICGVHCHRGDANCNGYCEGRRNDPPAATEEQRLAWAKKQAEDTLRAATTAWFEYAGMCPVGNVRTEAFDIYENVRRATLVH